MKVVVTSLVCDPCTGDRARKERHVTLRKKGCCVSGKPYGGVGRGERGEEGQGDGVKRRIASGNLAHYEGTRVRTERTGGYLRAAGEQQRDLERDRDTIQGWTRCRGRKGASGGASTGVRDRDQGESAPKRGNDGPRGTRARCV